MSAFVSMANHVERFLKIWNSLWRTPQPISVVQKLPPDSKDQTEGLRVLSISWSEDLSALQELEATVENILLVTQIA